MPVDFPRLAALSSRPRSSHRDEQPYRLRLDALGRCLELPGPRALARVFVLPLLGAGWDLSAAAGVLYGVKRDSTAAPAALNPDALAEEVLAALAALPPRPDASRPYLDLQLAAAHADPAELRLYVGKALQAARRQVPARRPPRQPRPAPKPVSARVAHFRQRARAAELASAEWWLRRHLAQHSAGERVAAPILWASCRDDLTTLAQGDASDPEVWAEYVEEDGAPAHLRVPGRQTFYAEADRLLGPRHAGHRKTPTYTLPEVPLPDALLEAVIDRAAEKLVERAETYAARRDRGRTATGTGGAVVDLATRRGAR